MNVALKKLPGLIAEELAAANEKNPAFHSPHEGYAVLLEEVEEAGEALENINAAMKMMWSHIKHDSPKAFEWAKRVEQNALLLAAEAIQVAAMAQKYQAMEE